MKQFILLALLSIAQAQIQWNGNWAERCRFNTPAYQTLNIPGEQCGPRCENEPQCSHFDWNNNQCNLKRGDIRKEDAVGAAQGWVCGVRVAPILSVNDVTFSLRNNCPYTIWPGMDGRVRSNPGWKLPFNGGWELPSGQTTNVKVPWDFYAGRFWARTGCSNVNGQFQCETGDCGPWVQCAHDGIHRGGAPPATLAEYTLNTNTQDYYDMSLVDGYNLKMEMRVVSPTTDPNNAYWCKNPTCRTDLNAICPNELRKIVNGRTVGCMSACERFREDRYCCHGAFDQPHTCRPETWPVNYSAIFKQACPDAYSYAYDDHTSTFFCRTTDYIINFC